MAGSLPVGTKVGVQRLPGYVPVKKESKPVVLLATEKGLPEQRGAIAIENGKVVYGSQAGKVAGVQTIGSAGETLTFTDTGKVTYAAPQEAAVVKSAVTGASQGLISTGSSPITRNEVGDYVVTPLKDTTPTPIYTQETTKNFRFEPVPGQPTVYAPAPWSQPVAEVVSADVQRVEKRRMESTVPSKTPPPTSIYPALSGKEELLLVGSGAAMFGLGVVETPYVFAKALITDPIGTVKSAVNIPAQFKAVTAGLLSPEAPRVLGGVAGTVLLWEFGGKAVKPVAGKVASFVYNKPISALEISSERAIFGDAAFLEKGKVSGTVKVTPKGYGDPDYLPLLKPKEYRISLDLKTQAVKVKNAPEILEAGKIKTFEAITSVKGKITKLGAKTGDSVTGGVLSESRFAIPTKATETRAVSGITLMHGKEAVTVTSKVAQKAKATTTTANIYDKLNWMGSRTDAAGNPIVQELTSSITGQTIPLTTKTTVIDFGGVSASKLSKPFKITTEQPLFKANIQDVPAFDLVTAKEQLYTLAGKKGVADLYIGRSIITATKKLKVKDSKIKTFTPTGKVLTATGKVKYKTELKAATRGVTQKPLVIETILGTGTEKITGVPKLAAGESEFFLGGKAKTAKGFEYLRSPAKPAETAGFVVDTPSGSLVLEQAPLETVKITTTKAPKKVAAMPGSTVLTPTITASVEALAKASAEQELTVAITGKASTVFRTMSVAGAGRMRPISAIGVEMMRPVTLLKPEVSVTEIFDTGTLSKVKLETAMAGRLINEPESISKVKTAMKPISINIQKPKAGTTTMLKPIEAVVTTNKVDLTSKIDLKVEQIPITTPRTVTVLRTGGRQTPVTIVPPIVPPPTPKVRLFAFKRPESSRKRKGFSFGKSPPTKRREPDVIPVADLLSATITEMKLKGKQAFSPIGKKAKEEFKRYLRGDQPFFKTVQQRKGLSAFKKRKGRGIWQI